MKIVFTPSFYKSLRKLRWHESWWNKIYEFFRTNLWMFFKNIWLFRKELYRHRNWDWVYSMSMLRRSLEELCNGIEYVYPYEIDETRLKKIGKMKRAIEILKMHENDTFISMAEEKLGYRVDVDFLPSKEPQEIREKNRIIFDLSIKLENEMWKELFTILKGQDNDELLLLMEKRKNNEDVTFDDYFDGSGMKSWWS